MISIGCLAPDMPYECNRNPATQDTVLGTAPGCEEFNNFSNVKALDLHIEW